MKDLTEYIESLFDDINLPLKISLQEDGSYFISITKDLKGSHVFYSMAIENAEPNIKYIRNQIKRYLPNLKVKLLVEYINYPNINLKPMLKEYKYGAWKIN
jgi:hypothetical protein